MYSPPVYVWLLILVGAVGILGLTSFALYRGAETARAGRRTAALLVAGTVLLFGSWYVTSGVIAEHGGYDLRLGQQPPWLPIAVLSTLVVLLALTRIPLVSRALAAPGTLGRIELAHTFRLVGVAFVIMMALGHLPAVFALPAGLGDMAVGAAAPFIAYRLAKGTGRRAAVWFNALGIVDLVVALTLGTLTGFQIIDVTTSIQAIGQLPLALIPTVGVPLLLTLHIVSLRQLVSPNRAREGALSALAAGGPA